VPKSLVESGVDALVGIDVGPGDPRGSGEPPHHFQDSLWVAGYRCAEHRETATLIFMPRCSLAYLIAAGLLLFSFEDPFILRRERMLREQIEARGIRNPDVLRMMRSTPRHLFVPEDLVEYAYSDRPLPIGLGQTISQPYKSP
jgi:hypothetical protein